MNWIKTTESLPVENKLINWTSPSGNVVTNGYRKGNLWFLGGMYVYYRPINWQYV